MPRTEQAQTRPRGEAARMLWGWIGFVISLGTALLAFGRSRAPGGFYDADVYGMTPRSHRRYAAIALAFTLAFTATLVVVRNASLVFWLLASAVLFDLFYLTSYLRGAHEDDA